ncbi:MAG: hypothetical protein JW749_06435 [Sedimentisphaerales bacterium]|nr:hypothetical protein [Sedimentisphaerales bacterium]
MSLNDKMFGRQKGIALPLVIAFAFILAIVGIGLLTLAQHEILQTRIETDKTRAFYYAESGLAKLQEIFQKPVILSELGSEISGSIEGGSYRVLLDFDQVPCYAFSIGTSGSVQKRIRVQAYFLAPPFENAVFAMNNTGNPYAFQLRGTGNAVPYGSVPGAERGGADKIYGNIFVDGDAYLYEQSSINPAPAPNPWGLNGDLGATGTVSLFGSASVSGTISQNAEEPDAWDLLSMDYANNNTHNVGQIFQSAGVSSGYLPVGNALRDVFVKNPGDRSAECATTTGDDYFFEPSTGFVTGGPKSGDTPLNAGQNRVYYVDGDVWIESNPTYGFNMEGRATIVATGNIHICDNLQYKDANSLLGMIALGKYDGSGNLVSGGSIYFGDPVYGNMAVFSAIMYAAKDFLFNTDRITNRPAEPDSGFIMTGSFAAMNQVSIERDWYTKTIGTPKPARYNTSTSTWVDAETGTVLTSTQISTLRHYQMVVNYDDRVRDQDTQPPGLPRGGMSIFAGFSNWEEI